MSLESAYIINAPKLGYPGEPWMIEFVLDAKSEIASPRYARNLVDFLIFYPSKKVTRQRVVCKSFKPKDHKAGYFGWRWISKEDSDQDNPALGHFIWHPGYFVLSEFLEIMGRLAIQAHTWQHSHLQLCQLDTTNKGWKEAKGAKYPPYEILFTFKFMISDKTRAIPDLKPGTLVFRDAVKADFLNQKNDVQIDLHTKLESGFDGNWQSLLPTGIDIGFLVWTLLDFETFWDRGGFFDFLEKWILANKHYASAAIRSGGWWSYSESTKSFVQAPHDRAKYLCKGCVAIPCKFVGWNSDYGAPLLAVIHDKVKYLYSSVYENIDVEQFRNGTYFFSGTHQDPQRFGALPCSSTWLFVPMNLGALIPLPLVQDDGGVVEHSKTEFSDAAKALSEITPKSTGFNEHCVRLLETTVRYLFLNPEISITLTTERLMEILPFLDPEQPWGGQDGFGFMNFTELLRELWDVVLANFSEIRLVWPARQYLRHLLVYLLRFNQLETLPELPRIKGTNLLEIDSLRFFRVIDTANVWYVQSRTKRGTRLRCILSYNENSVVVVEKIEEGDGGEDFPLPNEETDIDQVIEQLNALNEFKIQADHIGSNEFENGYLTEKVLPASRPYVTAKELPCSVSDYSFASTYSHIASQVYLWLSLNELKSTTQVLENPSYLFVKERYQYPKPIDKPVYFEWLTISISHEKLQKFSIPDSLICGLKVFNSFLTNETDLPTKIDFDDLSDISEPLTPGSNDSMVEASIYHPLGISNPDAGEILGIPNNTIQEVIAKLSGNGYQLFWVLGGQLTPLTLPQRYQDPSQPQTPPAYTNFHKAVKPLILRKDPGDSSLFISFVLEGNQKFEGYDPETNAPVLSNQTSQFQVFKKPLLKLSDLLLVPKKYTTLTTIQRKPKPVDRSPLANSFWDQLDLIDTKKTNSTQGTRSLSLIRFRFLLSFPYPIQTHPYEQMGFIHELFGYELDTAFLEHPRLFGFLRLLNIKKDGKFVTFYDCFEQIDENFNLKEIQQLTFTKTSPEEYRELIKYIERGFTIDTLSKMLLRAE